VRLRALLGFAFWAIIAASPVEAATSSEFLKLERVELEPYFGQLAKLKVYLNPVLIEGGIMSGLKPTDLKLEINGVRRKERPGILPFEYTDAPVDLVIVLQTSLRFAPALEDLQEPMATFLKDLPKATTRVGLIVYGAHETLHAYPLAEPAKTLKKLGDVLPEDAPDLPELVSALERAIRLLKQTPSPAGPVAPRRLMLIIGDGSNMDDESADTREEINKKIRLAVAEGITIHTVAFSMNDHRDPYKNLGQLSKKTAGTFRWARDRASFVPTFDALKKEILGQLVLTYFVPPELVVDGKVRVLCDSPVCGETLPLASNDRKVPSQPSCAGTACKLGEVCVAAACLYAPITAEGSHLGRTLALGAIVVVGAGAGTVFMRRRKAKKEEVAAAAAPPPQPVPQVVIPDFTNMPYLSGSAQAQQLQAMAAHMNAQLAAQAGAQRTAAPAPQIPQGRAGTLYIMNGPRQGQTIPLRHGFTIGKTPGCDLLVDDGYTSGYHAQFHLDGAGGCTVVDMNSTNGTYVNGVRTARQRLTHGMMVRAGGTEVRYLQG